MINIEKFREAIQGESPSLNFHLVRILKNQEVAMDGSSYQVEVETIPEEYDALVHVTQNENLEGGIAENQIWLAGFIDDNLNNGFLIRKIVNDQFKLHPKAKMGETVVSSLPKKKINLSNDHTAKLTENAVLGPELVKWILKLTAEIKAIGDKVNSLSTKFITHLHLSSAPGSPTGPASAPTPPPTLVNPVTPIAPTTTVSEKAKIVQLEQAIETNKFLSDLIYFQEKNLTNKPD